MLHTLLHTFALLAFLAQTAQADIWIKTHRAAATSGTQNFTIGAPNGDTPKGAFVTVSKAVTDNTVTTHAVMSYGFTDCTNEWSIGGSSRSALATSDENHRGSETQVVTFYDATVADGATIDAAADASCSADTITLTWSNAPASAVLVHLLVFGGSTWQNKAGLFTQNTTIDASTDVTDVGFTPEGVFCGASGVGPATWENNNASLRFGLGVATATAQGSISFNFTDAQTTSAGTGGTSSNYACLTSIAADFSDAPVELSGFDSQGFTATTRQESHGFQFAYFAYTTGGAAQSWTGAVSAPAAPETTAYTGPGWTPQGGLIAWAGSGVIDTEEVDDDAGVFALSFLDPTNRYTVGICIDDGIGSAVTSSLSDNVVAHVLGATSTTRLQGTLAGYTATGFDIEWTTTSVTVGWGWMLQSFATSSGSAGFPPWFN